MTRINSYRIADNCRAQMVKRGIAAVTILEDEAGRLSYVSTGMPNWKLKSMMLIAWEVANDTPTRNIDIPDSPLGPAEPDDG